MDCVTTSPAREQARSTSPASLRAVTLYGVVTAMTFSAASGAPTPLYRVYQDSFALSPFLITMIFAVYTFSLLASLLTIGSLSDYIGRRPVIFGSLIVNAAAMILFARADSAMALIVARLVQGLATGAALTTVGAAILDSNRNQGPLLNAVTPLAGIAFGVLGASALVTYAPAPAELVYHVLLALTAAEAVVLWLLPETSSGKQGALASLRPQIAVPSQVRGALLRVSPINIAAWALGGFYLSLMPSMVRMASGLTSPLIGGLVVSTLPFAAVAAIILFRAWPTKRILMAGTSLLVAGVVVTLLAVHLSWVPMMIGGSALAGLGFGKAYTGSLRSVLPLAGSHERAGLLSAVYIECYLAYALPAVLVGVEAPHLGLFLSTYLYGAAVIVLSLASLIAFRSMNQAH
jgi:Major Facilitator Superfamily